MADLLNGGPEIAGALCRHGLVGPLHCLGGSNPPGLRFAALRILIGSLVSLPDVRTGTHRETECFLGNYVAHLGKKCRTLATVWCKGRLASFSKLDH